MADGERVTGPRRKKFLDASQITEAITDVAKALRSMLEKFT